MSCAITCRLLRFRSPLLSESRLMSFPRATEMFQFTRFASHTYVFSMRYLCRWVSPFGNLRIKANLPAPRSLSQAITSFVAYHCQGIHHMLLFTWPYNFDISFKNQSIFKECLSGLSPDALCRIQLTWITRIQTWSLIFILTQSKLCCQQLRKARSALNLYECAVSSRSLKLATLIKLYKLLKNSRLIKRSWSTTK